MDQGVPPRRTGPNYVTVDVIRNKFPPVFEREPYTKEIKQDAQPGIDVLTVTARDRDTKVSPKNS